MQAEANSEASPLGVDANGITNGTAPGAPNSVACKAFTFAPP